MKKFKVKTPNESFAGKRHGVQFYRGEAEAELSELQIEEFTAFGYTLEEIVEKKAPVKKKTDK